MRAEISRVLNYASASCMSPSTSTTACPGGLFALSGVTVVEDAHEEIFELYMELAGSSTGDDTGGLGYMDGKEPLLDIELVLDPPKHERDSFSKPKRKEKTPKSIVVNAKVQQDLTALKGRKGDTGSVLWRSSLHLARHILLQHHFPPERPLIDPKVLKASSVLELGAGTGLLATLLSPLCGRYTASDRLENLALVRRNLELNKVKAELAEIDWEEPGQGDALYDLILAVDCIYNESLVIPLVNTINRYMSPSTIAWVVVELRSSDVVSRPNSLHSP